MPIRPENRSRYPKNWKQIADAARERAGNHCEGSDDFPDCRAENGKPHPVTGSKVVLTVGHLDHTPENCEPENLKAWCQRCHLNYDKHHHAQTAYATRKARALTYDLFAGEEMIATPLYEKTATISSCEKFRYRLGRRWGEGKPLVFVMFNPSTADADTEDNTIRRCVSFAKSHDYNAIDVVNLYAYRTPYPADLKAAGYLVGNENDAHITDAVKNGGQVCVACGDDAYGLPRIEEVLRLLHQLHVKPMVLKMSKKKIPRHPLYLSRSCRLFEFPEN